MDDNFGTGFFQLMAKNLEQAFLHLMGQNFGTGFFTLNEPIF